LPRLPAPFTWQFPMPRAWFSPSVGSFSHMEDGRLSGSHNTMVMGSN